MDLLPPEYYIWACTKQLKESLVDGFTTAWMACRHMKYLSCDEAGFMSLSCELMHITYETLKCDSFISYIWWCSLQNHKILTSYCRGLESRLKCILLCYGSKLLASFCNHAIRINEYWKVIVGSMESRSNFFFLVMCSPRSFLLA